MKDDNRMGFKKEKFKEFLNMILPERICALDSGGTPNRLEMGLFADWDEGTLPERLTIKNNVMLYYYRDPWVWGLAFV